MAGIPTFVEIGVPDASKARGFYEAVFPQWKWSDKPGGFRIRTETVTAGLHSGDEPNFVVYLSVDDLDAALESVRANGGKAGDIMEGGAEYGRFAECEDNQGVVFGLHQPPA
jgi:predicted enzyme related to lactoylglutathione lyase